MNTVKTYVVVGATGDVGRGVTQELLRAGFKVIAVSRNVERLQALKVEMGTQGVLEVLVGSVSNESSASELRTKLQSLAAHPNGIIVSVNAANRTAPLRTIQATDFLETLNANLIAHFIAIKALLPMLQKDAQYIAVGGGMADWVIPGFGVMSACQAAQRAMIKSFDAEQDAKAAVRMRELMLHSMIAGASNRAKAQPNWLTDEDVGRHVLLMLQQPEAFTETVVNLKSRKQVGQLPTT